MSKVLFIASEAQPLIKTGGLADVSGALPAALKALRCNVRLMLPAYAQVLEKLDKPRSIAHLTLPGIPGSVELLEDKLPNTNVKLILVNYAPAFDRPGNPYLDDTGQPWPDNAERFALLARAACEVALDRAGLNWQPDIVHCNDWQTGLVPALLNLHSKRPATVFTIHNLAYQGLFPQKTFVYLNLPPHLWSLNALEFHNQLSFIKGGLVFADRINTVSPRYAEEIQTPEFGCGLEGLLQYRHAALNGIINGIDDTEWNPETDPHIARHYKSEQLQDKQANKLALQKTFQLPQDEDALLLGFIGRLVEQKGIDLIIEAMEALAEENIQLVVLGTGEKLFHTQLQQLAQRLPQQVGVNIGYSEALAHQIEAGADAFLMPSRFEPCGLNQLYSLRYGTLPIVHNVGGLADTVTDISPENLISNQATGAVFDTPDADSLRQAIIRAYTLFQNPTQWQQVIRNGMQKSYNWNNSARQYLKLYKAAISQRNINGV